MPDDLQPLMARAVQAESVGDFQESERIYRQVLARQPNHSEAFLFHSLTLAKLGRVKESISQLQGLVGLQPKNLIALNWLSKLLRDQGQKQSALGFSEQAIRINPGDPEAIYNLGLCYLDLGRFEEAILCFEKLTASLDRFAPAYYSLACAYEAIGQPWPALLAIRKSVEIDPNPPGYLKLAQLNLEVGNSEAANEFGSLAHAAMPNSATHLILAESLADTDPDLARNYYDSAIQMDPTLELFFKNRRAKALSRLGRLDESQALNEKLMEEDSHSGQACLNWVTIKKISEDDQPKLERMLQLVGESGLPWEEKSALHLALGKSFDDLGDYESAISHFDQANYLKFAKNPRLRTFDQRVFQARIDFTIDLFSPKFIASNMNQSNESVRPIFIIGMMRTGTTLIEQILSRHPKIAAGGELAHWAYAEKKIIDVQNRQIRAKYLHAATKEYLEILETISPDAERVTDKNPANLMEVGLIRLAFPNAHFVQMSRDPIDTAMSVYITPTRNAPDFSGSRENIVFALKQTQKLADYWAEVVPASNYHRVSYEELVSSPEDVIRDLLQKLDLNSVEIDLGPSRTQTIIGTPSLWQARQPISTSSIGRSKRYEPWLGDFKKLS